MFDFSFTLIAMTLYLVATLFIALSLRGSVKANKQINAPANNTNIHIASALALIAVVFHISHALNISFVGHFLNFGLSSMVVLISGLIVALFLLGSIAMPIRRLGILVYPITALCLLFSLAWGNQIHTNNNTGLAFSAHIIVSITAYAVLSLATIQALLYIFQERQIKNRTNPAMLMALPPLQTMEQLLFRLVTLGFICLSLTLISGVIFSQEIFGHTFTFNHHTLLAILGWVVFTLLLFKHYKHGLRGTQAAIWTIGGFLLIQLGYFGTKIVSESLSLQ